MQSLLYSLEQLLYALGGIPGLGFLRRFASMLGNVVRIERSAEQAVDSIQKLRKESAPPPARKAS